MPLCLRLFLLLIIPLISQGQHQQRELFLYNVSCGAIVGGVGAVINKPKGENWKKALVRGLWQGSAGGTLNFCGKKMLYYVNRDYTLAYAWPAKIVHDAGTSIVEGAAANKPFLRDWHTDVGPVRLDFSMNAQQKATVRFLPASLYSIIAGFAHGRLDVSKSVSSGNLCFVNNDSYLSAVAGGYKIGMSYGRALVYINDVERYQTISHELVHQFQFDEYQSLNSWLIPLNKKVKSESVKSLFSKYVYFDMPYMVIGYVIEKKYAGDNFYKNFYEFEAESFSTNQYVKRH